MIQRLTYNCPPDSLNGISQVDFVDALENEFSTNPRFRECDLTVTFNSSVQGTVSGVSVTDEDSDDPADYEETIRHMAERAFAACCH